MTPTPLRNFSARSAVARLLLGVSMIGTATACMPASSADCIGSACGGDRIGGGSDTGSTEDAADTNDGSAAGESDTSIAGPACDARACDALPASELPPDADSDGIPDCIEGLLDHDGDGAADCLDDDTDADGIFDAIEGYGDLDGDNIPDFADADADGDGIEDRFERNLDPDDDGIPSQLDEDADNDGAPDSIEFGRGPGDTGPPVDTDGDGTPDFLDLDSDADGLADQEETGCPASSDRRNADSDSDGSTDLVELAFGTPPCDVTIDISGVVDFYFEIPFGSPEQSDTLEFSTNVRQGDVVFNLDTTGSMDAERNQLKSAWNSTIIPALVSAFPGDSIRPGAGYGVSRWDDFPCNGYGDTSSGDRPFRLVQRVTTDAAAAQAAVNTIGGHYGGDTPESGIESLYQLATGVGRAECVGDDAPAFDPAAGLISGVADGTIGGAGFRSGSVPIIVHVTDAPTQARGQNGYPYGATREEAYTALSGIGARVIGVASDGAARGDLLEFARRTGSAVPACAWDATRPGGCGAGQCCTGYGGGGRDPESDGLCPLVFDTDGNGNGLSGAVVSGIERLVRFAPLDLTVRLRRDETTFTSQAIDTTCFIRSVEPVTFEAPATACSIAQPTAIADLSGDGTPDGFVNVTPGSRLFFAVNAHNPCVRETADPQVFVAYLDIVAGGDAVLDTQVVTILVPPDLKQ